MFVMTELLYLKRIYPKLTSLFEFTGEVNTKSEIHNNLAHKVAEIVVGQMLSGAAANTICSRINDAIHEKTVQYPHELSVETLRNCGLSFSKIRTIHEFGQQYRETPKRFDTWLHLEYGPLKKEICSFWGLSEWTAEMLAISHYGHTDIYPAADGTIQRAEKLVRIHLDEDFDPTKGSPFRTYLAKCLWASIDDGFWIDRKK